MESWRKVWREGLAPLLSTAGLQALQTALETDDPRLMQGGTTKPPPLRSVQDWPVEEACAVCYCGWQGDGAELVGEAEERFARTLYDADQLLKEQGGVRWFLNWFDDTPRDEMRRELLPEVVRELERREQLMANVQGA